MASEAKLRRRDQEYINYVETAPPFGWKDKIGYMMGDLEVILYKLS